MKAEERAILNELIILLQQEVDEVDQEIVGLVRLRVDLCQRIQTLQKKAALSTLESVAKFMKVTLRKNRERVDEQNSREIL